MKFYFKPVFLIDDGGDGSLIPPGEIGSLIGPTDGTSGTDVVQTQQAVVMDQSVTTETVVTVDPAAGTSDVDLVNPNQ